MQPARQAWEEGFIGRLQIEIKTLPSERDLGRAKIIESRVLEPGHNIDPHKRTRAGEAAASTNRYIRPASNRRPAFG
jgi:hypothetical protein